VRPKDFAQERADVPMRFEIEVELNAEIYAYAIAFELPKTFKELRVLDEKLSVGSKPVFARERAQVDLAKAGRQGVAKFLIDWHLVALPIIQEKSRADPLFTFKQWLARVLVLRPMPSLISGDSEQETLQPNVQVTDFAAWFTAVVGRTPAAYSKIYEYLKPVMPDLSQIQNLPSGPDSKRLIVEFSTEAGTLKVSFEDLSDGEKCFMIWAVVLAANDTYGPLLCFWDEPDNYLAPWEIGHVVMALRKAFQSAGQFIATSHNLEAIDRFSRENTLFLYRKSHLEPTLVRPMSEIPVNGDLADALVRGDVEPS
jgi:hypothetical protein